MYRYMLIFYSNFTNCFSSLLIWRKHKSLTKKFFCFSPEPEIFLHQAFSILSFNLKTITRKFSILIFFFNSHFSIIQMKEKTKWRFKDRKGEKSLIHFSSWNCGFGGDKFSLCLLKFRSGIARAIADEKSFIVQSVLR